jgi:hypothetical protein
VRLDVTAPQHARRAEKVWWVNHSRIP